MVHPHAKGRISFFLWLNDNIYAYIFISNIFIHSCVTGHFYHFHALSIVNNAAIKMVVSIFLQDKYFIFFIYIPQSGIVGACYYSILSFWGLSILFFTVALPVYISLIFLIHEPRVPFHLFVSFSVSSLKSYTFQCTGISQPWLYLFLSISLF